MVKIITKTVTDESKPKLKSRHAIFVFRIHDLLRVGNSEHEEAAERSIPSPAL